MGLKKYEQEIAAAAAHPDTEHAVTVLESLARSLRRHEWPPERRGAAYDLAERAEAEARRLAKSTADRAAAQEITDREGYPVHVGCGGEVVRSTTLWEGPQGVVVGGVERRCFRCDLAVPASEVAEPGEMTR